MCEANCTYICSVHGLWGRRFDCAVLLYFTKKSLTASNASEQYPKILILLFFVFQGLVKSKFASAVLIFVKLDWTSKILSSQVHQQALFLLGK